MDDDYVGFPTKVFIDSNIVLEALPLKDLPWSEINSVGPILIMLTPTLLSEVDSKKRDGRLAVRAREFNRLVAPIATHGKPINLVAGTPSVDIVIAKCRRIDWAGYDDLDPSQGDARIIAEVLNVQGVPEEQKLVVSQDINPLFMAQRHGLKTLHVSDSWLPLPEPSPQEKEVTKLKRQLMEYSKTEPQFDIAFLMPPEPVEVHQVQNLTEREMSSLVKAIVVANPLSEQRRDFPLDLMQYDSTLNDRYSNYERKIVPNFVRNYHKKLEILFGQIPFTLSVKNSGNVRADHASIDVQVIGGWFNSKPIIAGLRPSAPKVRNPLFHTTSYRPPLTRPAVGRHEIEVSEPLRSNYFSAQCEDLRQGQEWEFSGVVWVDPHDEKDVVIIVKVTAANLHGETSTPFKFGKSVISSHVFDLVDINSGIVVKDYCIKPLVEEAIKEKRFGDVEWDRVSNED